MASSSTKYTRVRTHIEVSRASDYSDPLVETTLTDTTEPTRYHYLEVLSSTSATVVDLAPYGVVEDVIIHNRDGTNFVDVTYRNTANGANDNITRIKAGKTASLGSTITIANDLSIDADTADCECVVVILGTV